MAPKYIEPQTLEPIIVTLCGKRALLDVNKLRVLKWGGYLGLSGWTLNAMMCIFTRERQREI